MSGAYYMNTKSNIHFPSFLIDLTWTTTTQVILNVTVCRWLCKCTLPSCLSLGSIDNILILNLTLIKWRKNKYKANIYWCIAHSFDYEYGRASKSNSLRRQDFELELNVAQVKILTWISSVMLTLYGTGSPLTLSSELYI